MHGASFLNRGTGIELRSPVFHVILKSTIFIHSIQLSVLPVDMEALCEVELKSDVLYALRIKAVSKVLLFSSAYIH